MCHFLSANCHYPFPSLSLSPVLLSNMETRPLKRGESVWQQERIKMGNGKIDRKKPAPDPGNMLVVLYVGVVMSILFLAMALDSYAAVDGGADKERIRQVMFLTDGSVGNERESLGLIALQPGDLRLFTVGLGSVPNFDFMSRAAVMGRGSYTYIGKTSEVQQKMMQLF